MKKRTVSASYFCSTSRMVKKLPRLLDIFSLSTLHEAVVHPHVGQRLAGGALALGDLVLVVRELQVGAAAVDVEGVAQHLAAHGRAFDVPARAARP
jgi:hypothetical protein